MGTPKVIYRDQDFADPNCWIRYMATRVMRQNLNFLCAVNGSPGAGKTYSALSIAEQLSRVTGIEFTIHHVPFSFLEMMKLINSGELGRGSIIVFDEPQVAIGAKDHQSQVNKMFHNLASTFRHKNYILFFCNPFLEDLDKSVRKLFHAQFQVIGKDEINKETIIKPLYLQWNSKQDDFYHHFLKVVYKPKGKTKYVTHKLKRWRVSLPSKELIDQYEIKKKEFTSMLNKRIENALKDYEKDMEPEKPKIEIDTSHGPTETQLLYLLLLKKYRTLTNVARILNKSITAIQSGVKIAQKKGWSPENALLYAEKMGYTLENLMFNKNLPLFLIKDDTQGISNSYALQKNKKKFEEDENNSKIPQQNIVKTP